MIDEGTGDTASPLAIGSLTDLHAAATRREFLRVVALGGAIALLPGFTVACGSDAATGPSNEVAGSGEPLLIDFSQGDVAILQLALVIEQVQAEFYSRVVSSFATSNIGAAEQTVLTEMRDHQVAHREFLRATIGAGGEVTASATFRGVVVTDRSSVLAAAKSLEDLGVAAYDGAAQYLTSPDNLLALAKIASVEARHAATIRDLLEPRTSAFAPFPADDAFRPSKVAVALQANLADKLGFANIPATFVQGPNTNG
jgi:demethoxyubiquinone hydroxylase (CLK1/Coq7/Cat5 family)